MPFNLYAYEKIRRCIGRFKEERWQTVLEIPSYKTAEDDGTVGAKPKDGGEGVMSVGDRWQGYDKYIWLDTTVTIPECEGELWGRFDFGITGGGHNSGFESLLYINGHPWQGVDQNHSDVPLEAKSGDTLRLQFRLWSGRNGGGAPVEMEHRINRSEIAVLNPAVDKLYYMFTNMLEMDKMLPDSDPEKGKLLDIAQCAWDMIDTYSGKEEMYASAPAAVEYIEEKLNTDEIKKVVVSCVGHTHIDTAWLWTLDNTHEKCARSFSTVNRLMERYPEYIFMHTQAQQYDYVKKDYPEIFDNIKKRVKEGRWEPAGGMWVECDCNLPSGESLSRQILYGTRFFENEFGNVNKFLWLPDVFGYSAALPQILKKSGINTFLTTKIGWNDQNRMPYNTFNWKGIDGSEIIAHLIEGMGGYNSFPRPESVIDAWSCYKNKNVNREVLMSYGYGDGGGGVNRDMLENIRCLENMPGMYKVQTSRVDEFCDRLHETFEKNENNSYIPTWDGELYLEFHRGTYTSQAHNKKMNRRMEFLLRRAEIAVSQAQIMGRDVSDEKATIEKVWKDVLCLQFHDIIPGSSIHEVYEDSRKTYDECEKAVWGVIDSLSSENGKGVYVWNTANWKRNSDVEIKGDFKDKHFEYENGEAPVQYADENGAVVYMENLSMGQTKLIVKDGAAESESFATVSDNSIETPLLSLTWNENGHLTSVYDKKANRELIPNGERANVMTVYEDRPHEYDAWELEYTHQRKGRDIDKLLSVKVLENNGVRAVVEFVHSYGKSTFTQNVIVYPHTKRIDFKTKVDWNERELVLKTAFPTVLRSNRARFDIQYGSVERPTTSNTSWEAAKFETVGHKWVDLSESGYGVALMNDSKYGYDVHNGVMRLTLLKSANYPDFSADAGVQEFTYSLFMHEGEWYSANVDNESWELNEAPVVTDGKLDVDFFNFDNAGVTVSAIKPSEEGEDIILRLHEKEGRHTRAVLPLNFDIVSWSECDMLERNEGEAHCGNTIELDFTPFEIKTVKIKTK